MKILNMNISHLDDKTILNQICSLILFLNEAQEKYLKLVNNNDKKYSQSKIKDIEYKIILYKKEALLRMSNKI